MFAFLTITSIDDYTNSKSLHWIYFQHTNVSSWTVFCLYLFSPLLPFVCIRNNFLRATRVNNVHVSSVSRERFDLFSSTSACSNSGTLYYTHFSSVRLPCFGLSNVCFGMPNESHVPCALTRSSTRHNTRINASTMGMLGGNGTFSLKCCFIVILSRVH